MRRPCSRMVDAVDRGRVSVRPHVCLRFQDSQSTITNTFSPSQQLIRRHVIEDSLWIKLGVYRRSYAEFHELKLRGTVRVRSHRNAASFFLCDREQIDAEILTVRIAVNFNRFVELRRQSEDPCPIGAQAKAKVVDTSSGMTKYLN